MRSQSRQENFSRTCWITFHCRGTTSRVSVTSSPSLDRRVPPQQAHAAETRDDHALPRQVLGKWTPRRAGAGEPGDGGGLGRGSLGRQLVLRGGRFELLELQLHLIQQAGCTLGARAEAVAVELLDLQLEMGDQREVAGSLGQVHRRPVR